MNDLTKKPAAEVRADIKRLLDQEKREEAEKQRKINQLKNKQ